MTNVTYNSRCISALPTTTALRDVEFEDETGARKAIDALHGKQFLDNEVTVQIVTGKNELRRLEKKKKKNAERRNTHVHAFPRHTLPMR